MNEFRCYEATIASKFIYSLQYVKQIMHVFTPKAIIFHKRLVQYSTIAAPVFAATETPEAAKAWKRAEGKLAKDQKLEVRRALGCLGTNANT